MTTRCGGWKGARASRRTQALARPGSWRPLRLARAAATLLVVVVVWVSIAADLIVHDLDVVVLSRVLNGRSHLAKFGFILHRHQRVTVHPEHDGRVGMIRRL